MIMALCRCFSRTYRGFHSTTRILAEDIFDFTQIVKSNTAQKGFNDIEKKKSTSAKTKKTTKTKTASDEDSPSAKKNLVKNDDTTSTKKTSKTAKTVKTKTAAKKKGQTDLNDKPYKVPIPDWMDLILEHPSNPDDTINSDKFREFRDFVEELELRSLPSVTTIIKKTEPEDQAQVLVKWTQRKTKELGGEAKFEQYRNMLLTRGSSLHHCIEKYLAGERDFDVEPHIEGPWESIQHVLPELTDVRQTEKVIVHPELFYKGQIDCLAAYKNDFSLVEWKVSSKPKIMLSQTYDNPLQVAAYIGALNRSGVLKRLKIPSITNGVLVITYEDGEPANVHHMNEKICNRYWTRWTFRLYHYWALQYQEMMTKK